MKNLLPLLLMAVLLVLLTTFSQTNAAPRELAAKANNKDKLVGKWALEKSTNRFNGVPPGCSVEFTSDGVISGVAATGHSPHSGTYKVDGDRIFISLKDPYGMKYKYTVTIITLTDKKLVIKDKSGVTDTYKKK